MAQQLKSSRELGWRPISRKRARILRKRGETVAYRPDLGQLAWRPVWPVAHCRSCPEVDPDNPGVDWGCLPCLGEIRAAVAEGAVWECHSRSGVPCACAVNESKRTGRGLSPRPTLGETWGDAPQCWR